MSITALIVVNKNFPKMLKISNILYPSFLSENDKLIAASFSDSEILQRRLGT